MAGVCGAWNDRPVSTRCRLRAEIEACDGRITAGGDAALRSPAGFWGSSSVSSGALEKPRKRGVFHSVARRPRGVYLLAR